MARKSVVTSSTASAIVAEHVRQLILNGELRRGQKLPPERDLVQRLDVSRASVRAGLQLLANKGVLVIRHGTGTFVADGPLVLDSEQFHFLSTLLGSSRGDMFEARRSLESTVAVLAAQRATGDDLAAIADAVTGMFASLGDPTAFLGYDVAFHRAVADSAKSKILASLVEMVSGAFFEARKSTAHRGRDLRSVAEKHRLIYLAIRSRDAAAASRQMIEHLAAAERLLQAESGGPVLRAIPARPSDDDATGANGNPVSAK